MFTKNTYYQVYCFFVTVSTATFSQVITSSHSEQSS